jgi:predicted nucleic acid-binding protein
MPRFLLPRIEMSGGRGLSTKPVWSWVLVPLVPAPVVAEVSRSPQQAQLRRFLAGCSVVPLGENGAHEAGRLLAIARTADVVDAVVVTVALRNKAVILTGDPADMERLVRASGREAVVITV